MAFSKVCWTRRLVMGKQEMVTTATAWQIQQLKAVSSLFQYNRVGQPPDTGCGGLLLDSGSCRNVQPKNRFFSSMFAIFFPAPRGFVIYKPSFSRVKVMVVNCVNLERNKKFPFHHKMYLTFRKLQIHGTTLHVAMLPKCQKAHLAKL